MSIISPSASAIKSSAVRIQKSLLVTKADELPAGEGYMPAVVKADVPAFTRRWTQMEMAHVRCMRRWDNPRVCGSCGSMGPENSLRRICVLQCR